MTPYGITGQSAPEWRADTWFANNDSDTSLRVADIDELVIAASNSDPCS